MRDSSKIIVLVAAALVLLAGSVSAQTWSEKQTEVWNNVETYWGLWAAEDMEGFKGYLHDDYVGWSNESPLPGNKADFDKWAKYQSENYSMVIYDIKPVAIGVFDDVAVVHYYYEMVYSDTDGEKTNVSGRWTDILKKQGDQWFIIGDHGGMMDD